MGLFSSKKKIIVTTTVQPIFADTQIPNSPKTGMIKALIRDEDIVENVLEEMAHSIGIRANAGFLWAERNNYFWGLPESKVVNAVDAKGVITQILVGTDQADRIHYVKFGPMNSMHWAYEYAVKTWDYDPETNELKKLTPSKGSPVYLEDMIPVYAGGTAEWNEEMETLGELENWGFSPKSGYTPNRPYNTFDGMGQYAKFSPFKIDENAIEDYLEVYYSWIGSNGVIQNDMVKIPMIINNEADFHQARYTRKDGTTGFFTYEHDSGGYTAVDSVFDIEYENMGTYYPWAYLRHSTKDVRSLPDKKAWSDVKRWSEFLGVDIESIANMVHEDPEVDAVAQCILFFGVNPESEHQAELHYLFEYFLQLYLNSVPQSAKANGSLADLLGYFSNSLDQAIVIRDKYFKMQFSFSGIRYQRKVGNIGEVGTYTGERVRSGRSSGLLQTFQSGYVYRKQVYDTVYEEIHVTNPRLFFDVSRKKGYTAGPGDDELLIPLDHAIVDTMSVKDREQLISRGLHLCVNTYQEIKTKWYQSSWFRIAMIIIAVVVTVFSMGTAWASITAAAAIGVAAVTWVIITYIVTAMIVNYAVKLFVKALGPEWAFLAAIAAMAVGVYGMRTNTTWGESLLVTSNNIAKESVRVQTELVNDFMTDMSNEMAWMQDQMDSLSDTRKELGLDYDYSGLSAMDFVTYRPLTVMGEAPTDYYYRSVHAGNIGAMSLQLAENFHSLKLQLPSINDTMSEDF